MGRLRYLLARTGQTVLLLWAIITFLFFLFRLLPGSYIDVMLFRGASTSVIEEFTARWGLDKPLYVQYWIYIQNLVQLNLGQSMVYNEPIWQYVDEKIFNSLILSVPAITVGYLIGSVIGGVSGTHRGSRFEKFVIVPFVLAGSSPIFFTGMVLIVVFSAWLGWFPTSGMVRPETLSEFASAPWWRTYLTKDFLWHYTLPFTAVVLRYIYFPALLMRTTIVEIMDQDFIYYSRITGIPKVNRTLDIMKHASIPIVTLFPTSLGRAIGGLVLLEVVFNWPGIGTALVEAVSSRDTQVIQFVFFVIAASIVIGNWVVDIAIGIIDPRISVRD